MKKDVVAVLLLVIAKPFEKKGQHRTRKDIEILELVLTLVRNLLAITDAKENTSSSDSHLYSLHDRFIAELDQEHFFDFLILLGNSIEETENKSLALILFEILYLIFRREDPKELAYSAFKKGTNLGKKLGDALKTLRESQPSKLSSAPTRHSRFGGCFVSNNQLGSRSLKLRLDDNSKPLTQRMKNTLRRKNKAETTPSIKPTGNKTRVILKDFAERVSSHCFNAIIKSIKTDIIHGSTHLVKSDHDNFTWIVGFFTGFITHSIIRRKESLTEEPELLEFSYLSNAFDEQMFHYIIQNIEKYTNEKNTEALTLRIYSLRFLVETLQALYFSEKPEEKISGDAVLMKIVYQPDLVLDRLVGMIKNFSSNKHTKSYIQNVVYLTHSIMHTLEVATRDNNKKFLQLKKHTGRATDLKKDDAYFEKEQSEYIFDDFIVENSEDEESDAKKYKKGEDDLLDDENIEDELLDHEENNFSRKTKKALLEEDDEVDESLKHVKETNDVEGALLDELFSDSEKEDELNSLDAPDKPNVSFPAFDVKNDTESISEHGYHEYDDQDAVEKEKYFEFDIYLNNFARQSIIRAYLFLLRNFAANNAFLNHCIVSMYRRLSDFLDLKEMFFQVSYLRMFNTILNSKCTRPDDNISELKIFCAEIVKAMALSFKADPVHFASIMLIAKNKWEVNVRSPDRFETVNETDSAQVINDELEMLENPDAGEWDDEVEDFDLDELLAKEVKKTQKSSRIWNDDEDQNLKETYEAFKDVSDMNLVDVIVSMVDIPNLNAIDCYNRLLEIGLTDGSNLLKPEEESVEEPDHVPIVVVKKKKKNVNQVRKTKKSTGRDDIDSTTVHNVVRKKKSKKDGNVIESMTKKKKRKVSDDTDLDVLPKSKKISKIKQVEEEFDDLLDDVSLDGDI